MIALGFIGAVAAGRGGLMMRPRSFVRLICVLQAFLCLSLTLPTLREGLWLTTVGLSAAAIAFLVARVIRRQADALSIAAICLATGLAPLGLADRMPWNMIAVFAGSGFASAIVAWLLGPLATTRSA